jgi:hypothetical protein
MLQAALRAAIQTLGNNSNAQIGGIYQLKCLLAAISRSQRQHPDLAVPQVGWVVLVLGAGGS